MAFRGAFIGSLLAVAGWGGACAAAPAVLSVQFAPLANGTEIVLTLATPASFHAEVAGTAAYGRIEVTIGATGVALGATAGRGFGAVSSFREASAESGHTSYVFDLARPMTIAATHLVAGRAGGPVRAVIDLAAADPIAMAAMIGQEVNPTPVAEPYRPAEKPPIAAGRPVAKRLERTPASRVAQGPPIAAAVKHTIVIDPGHGGIDPGADSIAGYPEKEITLATARALRRALEDTGRYRVVLTRDNDIYLKLPERVRRARAAHGDLFISLHADSLGAGPLEPAAFRGHARGASIYTLSETASDAESERLAQHENRVDALDGVDLSDKSDDVAGILVDLAVRETVNDGNRFAGLIVKSFRNDHIALFPRMPHRSAGFAVLKAPDIPSVLVEMGYLSDINEARGLADPAYRARIATAITEAVDRYFALTEAAR